MKEMVYITTVSYGHVNTDIVGVFTDANVALSAGHGFVEVRQSLRSRIPDTYFRIEVTGWELNTKTPTIIHVVTVEDQDNV